MCMKQSPNIVLIGFQTSGKTTIGKEVACQFQRMFFDTDQLIEAAHPSWTCNALYLHYGESYFRQQEDQISQSFAHSFHQIIAVGGGTALHYFDPSTQFIYLKTSLSLLKNRLEKKSSPPAYLQNYQLESLYDKRIAYYEKWATQTLEMDNLTIQEAVQWIGEKNGL